MNSLACTAIMSQIPSTLHLEHKHMKFQDKFVGFLDVLGFKTLVAAAEDGTGMSLSQLLDLLKILGSPEDRNFYEEHGPTTCPNSKHVQRNLDFRVTQISDCVIVSSEVSPAGVINLIHHLWATVLRLLENGLLCRGYITRGTVYHTDCQIIGSAYQEAYVKEAKVDAFKRSADERGTPFVEIDPVVSEYIIGCTDSCVEKFFGRYVKQDGNTLVLFPFQRLVHGLTIWGPLGSYDPVTEKQSNQHLRDIIVTMKKRLMLFVNPENKDAVKKTEYYIRALDEQLEKCDRMDELIDKLSAPSQQNNENE